MTDKVLPSELIAVLNIAHKAPTTLGEAYALSKTLDKLVALANQPHPIGVDELLSDKQPSVAPGSSSSDLN